MFVRVRKKAPREYYYKLILDYQACRINLSEEQLRFVIEMKNKKDNRKEK